MARAKEEQAQEGMEGSSPVERALYTLGKILQCVLRSVGRHYRF